MKKTIFCTALLWVIALTGYAQSFSVPKPKGLQCGDMPSWPISHTKKTNNIPNNTSSKNAQVSKPVTSVFLSPLLKIWLMTEPAAGKEEE
jgi:hypothetical protein